jgi:SPP1 gp7 family putative phage head morphogenesis protein
MSKPKPFNLPKHQRFFQRERDRMQDVITDETISKFDRRMKEFVKVALKYAEENRKFPADGLQEVFHIGQDFYFDIIRAAVHISKQEQGSTTKRLARPPLGLPKKIRFFDEVFGSRKYWQQIMKRNKILTDRLRKQYFGRLREAFNAVLPKINDGSLAPAEAEKYMVGAWQSSRSQVRTVFRTEATTYFAKTQTSFFNGDDDIIGFLFDRVRDVATTEICNSRHGLVYRPNTKLLTDNTPALHYNCRSHLIPLANTARNRKLLEDPERDPANRKVEPLPKGWRPG